MNKLLEIGRKALFYVRVLSGYEERRIRNYRLQIEQRLRQAQARKAALKKIPEQLILSEVRRMVEEMQNLNKQIDEIEASFEDYFKPIDKQAEIIMQKQLEGEEKRSKEMLKAMQSRAFLEKIAAEKDATAIQEKMEYEQKSNAVQANTSGINQEMESTTKQHAEAR